jgi:hypothetical protein
MADPTPTPGAMTQAEAIKTISRLVDVAGGYEHAAWERLLEDVVPAPGSQSPRLTLEQMGTWAAPYQKNTHA